MIGMCLNNTSLFETKNCSHEHPLNLVKMRLEHVKINGALLGVIFASSVADSDHLCSLAR